MIANPGVRSTSRTGAQRNYIHHMMSSMTNNYERRRRQEANLDAADVRCWRPRPRIYLMRGFFPSKRGFIDVQPAPPLKVMMSDMYAKDNAKSHFTSNYELVNDIPSTPVLRRGFPFFVALRFDRSFEPPEDIVKLILEFGPNPSITKGTKSIVNLTNKNQFTSEITKWDALINEQNDDTMTLEIRSPVTCQVGIWRFTLLTCRASDPSNVSEYKFDDDIYLLFNPWCKDDTVFMADEKEKKEYITNETGKLWMGSFRQPKGRRWIFGQFDDAVLPTIMYLLELSDLPHSERGNSVHMVRAISAVINSADDDGLIVGRWDGDYKDGTAPHSWTGSVAIMEQFLRDGGMPVKYGQCWVFSALVVTVCRALGIPCRSVTNYVSAHDTNASLTVDKYFDKEGNEIKGGPDGECYDSCWNFHVWNDVWMSRPDLPQGYGGWQIIDATPQEESDSVYRCGPASREAVKQGKVGFLYDTPFVFAEVNADVCHFQEDEKSDWGFSRMRMNKYHVGRRVITKRVDRDDDNGDSDMCDVTQEYKNPEGTNDERLAVFNAVRGVSTAQKYYDFPEKHEEDVEFDLVEIDHIKFGQPFSIIVHLKNKGKEPRNIEAILSASSVFYTGVTVHRLKRAHAMFKLQPGAKETLRVTVTAANYIDKLVDHSLIKIFAIANVRETRQTWSEEDDFPLVKPKMDVRVTGKVAVGQKFNVTFSFPNPLQRRLTNCSYQIEGPGLTRPKAARLPKDVEPDDAVTINETFTPKKLGPRKIIASFNSNELQEVMGVTTVNVQ